MNDQPAFKERFLILVRWQGDSAMEVLNSPCYNFVGAKDRCGEERGVGGGHGC